MKPLRASKPLRRKAAAGFLLAASLVAFVTSAWAQPPANEMELNIPGQPLAESLIELGRASGLRIVATGSVVGDRNAPALAGRYTPKQALDALLIGSGLMATQETDGTYVIRRDPDSAGVEDTKAVPAARTVEEILVFGVKQAIDLQDTVESAEVFTADRFDRENLFTISDALGRTPNVSTLGDDLTSINIRGINREGTNGAGQGVAINVFQDGVPLTSGSLEFGASTAWDIEQLEVLRGSQSTVQGRNSIAGAIVLQSKKPTFDWEGAARARAAEYGTLQLAAALSGPIIEDQLAFRLTVDSQETDGFIRDGLSSDTIDFRESVTVRTRFLVEPEAISDLSALFTIEYSDRNNGGASNAISERGDIDFETSDRRSFAELINFADIETWKGIADITYRFNESIVLKVLGTYEDTDLEGGNRARTANQFADVGSFDDEVTEAYSIEVRAEFDFGKLRGLAGGYYFESEGTSAASQTLVLSDTVPFPFDPVDSALTVSATSVREVENFALFTSWRFEPTDNWALDVALRYDDERFTTRRAPGTFDVFPADCTAFAPRFFFGLSGPGFAEGSCQDAAPLFIGEVEPLQSDSLSVLLPSGSLTYRITEDASIFGGYRRGYRAGGTFLAGSLSATEIFEVVTFDPEFLNTYEAGWRSQWLEKRLTLNGTLFYSEYEDQQVSFLDERDFPITDNVGETSLYGLELTGSYIFNENLNLFASLGLLETSVDEFIRAVDVPETPENEFEDFSGNELDRSPAVSANLGASYRASNGFFASASVAYQSEYFSDIFNSDDDILGNGVTERVDAAAVVNANIGFDFTDGLRITLYANNLFDEDAPESTNINARGAEEGDTSRATINYRVRQPQTFGVAVDARF